VYLCVLCGHQNKQRLFHYTASADAFVEPNAKLLPAAINLFVSVRVQLFDSLRTDYRETLESAVLKSVEKTEVWIKWFTNNQQHLCETHAHLTAQSIAIDKDLPYFLKPLTRRVLHENKNVHCKLACRCNMTVPVKCAHTAGLMSEITHNISTE